MFSVLTPCRLVVIKPNHDCTWPSEKGPLAMESVSQSISHSVSHSVSRSASRNTDHKIGPPRHLTPESHGSNRHDHDAPISCACSMESIKMAAATSRGPVFTYAVFLHPAALSSRRRHHAACYLSPGCHRQYRHICWSWYESSENEVLFKERRSKNRVREQHSAVEGDTTEGNGQTVGQKRFFGQKLPHFPLFITWSFLAAMSGFTSPATGWVIESAAWRNLLSDTSIQVTVSRLLSLECSQHVTVIRLLSTDYIH